MDSAFHSLKLFMYILQQFVFCKLNAVLSMMMLLVYAFFELDCVCGVSVCVCVCVCACMCTCMCMCMCVDTRCFYSVLHNVSENYEYNHKQCSPIPHPHHPTTQTASKATETNLLNKGLTGYINLSSTIVKALKIQVSY